MSITNFTYGETDVYDVTKSRLADLLARGAIWFAKRAHRQQIMLELRSLADRELADIGLGRRDIPRVFDPEFVRTFRS